MRRMRIGIPSRAALILCGAAAVLVSRLFSLLQELQIRSSIAAGHWHLFSIAFSFAGVLSIIIALLPNRWAQVACNVTPQSRGSAVPMRMLGCFALASYLLTLGLDFAPQGWIPGPQLVYAVCPSCIASITVDASLGTVLLILAPLSAAAYGAVGASLAYIFLGVRNRMPNAAGRGLTVPPST
jgi:hypothetical protein